MLYVDDVLESEVAYWHSTGMAPSEIDKKLKLDAGTAHDVMITKWAAEKRKGSGAYRG